MEIFTIGHSGCSGEELISLLKTRNIQVIVDVRPLSLIRSERYFQSVALEYMLKRNKIKYLNLGDQLGVEHGIACADVASNFDEARNSGEFLIGISRLESGLKKGYNICLLCNEENPAVCHRNKLIAPALKERGIITYHIRKNGCLEENPVLLESDTSLPSSQKRIPAVIKDTLMGWRRKKQGMKLKLVD